MYDALILRNIMERQRRQVDPALPPNLFLFKGYQKDIKRSTETDVVNTKKYGGKCGYEWSGCSWPTPKL